MSTMPPMPEQAPRNIPTYLGWSIAVTVIAAFVTFCTCCGLGAIPGIVAIVFSSQANAKLRRGDLDGARSAATTAKVMCWVTAGFALLCLAYLAWSIHEAGGVGAMGETIREAFEEGFEQARRQR